MEALVVLALIGAVVFLWRRVDRLEREVAALRSAPVRGEPVPATVAVPVTSAPLGNVDIAAAVPILREPLDGLPPPKPWRGWKSLPKFDFEDLFGRLLPIWAGGVTLAAAGFFLVRWSIDAGLLTPTVRVLLAGLFGIALVAGAEAAFRWRERVADPRVAQALAGAGLATLYAAFYLAGSAYGLIGSSLAFVGLAAVTAAAIGLSFRFGLPSAVLALVGGFAAPALVGSEDANLPLLTLYLALVTAGLAFTGRRQDRAWLGVAALAGGIGWGALLIVGGAERPPETLILGAYLVLLGAVVPALAGGGGRPHFLVRVGAAGLAALQLAVLVQQGGFGSLEWGLYLLLGAALAWFGWREAAMREANVVAAAVGVALLGFWPDAGGLEFAPVAAGLAAIFALVPLAQLWRGTGRAIDVGQATGVALGLAAATHLRFLEKLYDAPNLLVAIVLAALSGFAAAAAWLAGRTGRVDPRWIRVAQAVTVLMAYDAAGQIVPQQSLAWLAAIVCAALAWRSPRLVGALAVLAAICGLWALQPLGVWAAAGLKGIGGLPILTGALPSLRSVALYLLPLAVASAAWRLISVGSEASRRLLEAAAIGSVFVVIHIVFRLLFETIFGANFVETGVIERAAWEALLLAAAWTCHMRGWPRVAVILVLAALAHFAWFSILLHNPLWSEQAVGLVPVANGLVAMYGAGLAALVLLRRWFPAERRWIRWAVDAVAMITIALFALSELRQAFAGTILTAPPISQTEDLLRSLTGIVLAVGFLLWGSRGRGGRSWRVGSLAVMVVAVFKVFLVDAAGLEGLARVASFMALGFSLIGIGWFYNRQLRGTTPSRSDG